MSVLAGLLLDRRVWILAVAALGVWWIHNHGVQAERARWEAKLAKADAEWADKLEKANNANAALKLSHQQTLATIDATHQQEIRNAKARDDADRADIRRGALRLFDPHATVCPKLPTARDALATAGVGDGASGGQLSPETTEFLVSEANRADAITKQLTEAQAVIVEYQRTCNSQTTILKER
ncbi:MAG: lysis system i-spanin subunit Rz [Burkholderiales bacterium]